MILHFFVFMICCWIDLVGLWTWRGCCWVQWWGNIVKSIMKTIIFIMGSRLKLKMENSLQFSPKRSDSLKYAFVKLFRAFFAFYSNLGLNWSTDNFNKWPTHVHDHPPPSQSIRDHHHHKLSYFNVLYFKIYKKN